MDIPVGTLLGETEPPASPRPPGPSGWPLIGNAYDILDDPRGFYEELSTYGDIVSYRVPMMRFTAILNPRDIERVLVTDYDQFSKFGFDSLGGEFGREGLLFTEGEQWQRQRRIAQDAFTVPRIRQYHDAMIRYASAMVDEWDDGTEVALNRAFSRLTLRILSRSLFDLDLAADTAVVTETANAINDRGSLEGISTFLPLWVPTPKNIRFRRTIDRFSPFVEALIDERRSARNEFDDLLAIMLSDNGPGLTDTELRDTMATFLFAGHETTSLALTFLLMEVAKRPAVRERLDAEYATHLAGDPPAPTDLDDLVYTERVINETLRLYPPVFMLFREVAEDVTIGDYRIPAGTNVTLPQFFVHRDERWYDDPDAFDPGRWSADRMGTRPEYAFFPFGGGPRHCIGMRFAIQELKAVVPTILQRTTFELRSDPDPDLDMAITMRPAEDVRVRVTAR